MATLAWGRYTLGWNINHGKQDKLCGHLESSRMRDQTESEMKGRNYGRTAND